MVAVNSRLVTAVAVYNKLSFSFIHGQLIQRFGHSAVRPTYSWPVFLIITNVQNQRGRIY